MPDLDEIAQQAQLEFDALLDWQPVQLLQRSQRMCSLAAYQMRSRIYYSQHRT
jgi:hypothetical protein